MSCLPPGYQLGGLSVISNDNFNCGYYLDQPLVSPIVEVITCAATHVLYKITDLSVIVCSYVGITAMDAAAVALFTTLSHKSVVLHIKRIAFSHVLCVLHTSGLNGQLIDKKSPTAKFHHFQHPQADRQANSAPPTGRDVSTHSCRSCRWYIPSAYSSHCPHNRPTASMTSRAGSQHRRHRQRTLTRLSNRLK